MTSTAGTNAEAAGSPAVEANQEQNRSQDLLLDRGLLLDQGPQEVKNHFKTLCLETICRFMSHTK